MIESGRSPATGRLRVVPQDDGRDLVRRCRDGDRDAWATLYRTYAPTVLRFLRRMLGSQVDEEDLLQQVFVEFVSSLERFRGDARLSTWLYSIASHVAVEHQRREVRWRRKRLAFAAFAVATVPLAPDAGGSAEARAMLRTLESAVGRLDLDHRTVWVLRDLEGLGTDEVASALDIPAGTVRSRLFHARRLVLEALQAAGIDPDSLPTRSGTGGNHES